MNPDATSSTSRICGRLGVSSRATRSRATTRCSSKCAPAVARAAGEREPPTGWAAPFHDWMRYPLAKPTTARSTAPTAPPGTPSSSRRFTNCRSAAASGFGSGMGSMLMRAIRREDATGRVQTGRTWRSERPGRDADRELRRIKGVPQRREWSASVYCCLRTSSTTRSRPTARPRRRPPATARFAAHRPLYRTGADRPRARLGQCSAIATCR